jgi:hypothetical protein
MSSSSKIFALLRGHNADIRDRIFWQSCVSQVAFSRICGASILASLEPVPASDPTVFNLKCCKNKFYAIFNFIFILFLG